MLWGIGVGPGPSGYIPVAALEALRQADVVFAPRARSAASSVALQCLAGIDIPTSRLREIEFNMDTDRTVLRDHYTQLAETVALELRAGRNVAYLTIGYSLTYSPYGYVLAALRERLPSLSTRTLSGHYQLCGRSGGTRLALGRRQGTHVDSALSGGAGRVAQ